jgi:hypothetical protein
MIAAITRPRPSPIGITRARSNFDGLTAAIVDPTVGLAALEDVPRRELAGVLDPQPRLQDQLEQLPVPEGVDLARPRRRIVRSVGERLLGVLPGPQGQRSDPRDRAIEVEHRGLLAAGLP